MGRDAPRNEEPLEASWSAPAKATSVPELRGAITRFAADAGLPDPPLADVRLAVSEALTNAVVHGYRHTHAAGNVDLAIALYRDEVHVTISDAGIGFSPRPDSPGLGLGMSIMRNVAQEVEVRAADPGTELRLRFNVAR